MSRLSLALALASFSLLLLPAACESARTDASTTDQFTGFTESSPEWQGESWSESCADDPILCINQLERATIDLEDMVLMHCSTPRPLGSGELEPQGLPRCTIEQAIDVIKIDGELSIYSPGLCEGTCIVEHWSLVEIANRIGVPFACGCEGATYSSYRYCRRCGITYQCEVASSHWQQTDYRYEPASESDAEMPKSPAETPTDHFRPCARPWQHADDYARDVEEHRALSCSVPASQDDWWRARWCMRVIPRGLVPEDTSHQVYELDAFLDHSDDWQTIRERRIAIAQGLWEHWQADPAVRIPISDWEEFEYRPTDTLEDNPIHAEARVRALLDEVGEGHDD